MAYSIQHFGDVLSFFFKSLSKNTFFPQKERQDPALSWFTFFFQEVQNPLLIYLLNFPKDNKGQLFILHID
ncbi:hypothetical protein DRO91_00875 [Candidatus Heimdallarchaeota archaeon]|nr:MAG: hypothetical protein DRP02_01220 [Candidatus Gerdarchaeota archaeon]RLI74290.1 MAG: hypothetical protein DRO91_00875 [Candidatus Heimdallarchaeota archaeon]